MTKRVLITAGTVYGPLDTNKLVGNRIRGIWAARFAAHLSALDHSVTLLVPDTMPWQQVIAQIGETAGMGLVTRNGHKGVEGEPCIEVVWHKGFWDYQEKCIALAKRHDAAVMAAAVVNWIPAEPYEGKMPTKGFKEGDIIQVPFVLAPHVIDQMKAANPKLTLIGCKMLVNASEDDLIEAAYGVLLKAKCNAVVANDMGGGLRRKLVVNQDRTVQEYNDDFVGFYDNLVAHIEDEHYSTSFTHVPFSVAESTAGGIFNAVVAKYQDRFIKRQQGADEVFGAIYVPMASYAGGLISTREKGTMFSSRDATILQTIVGRQLLVFGPNKATLNAPLLYRVADKYNPVAVIHLHEQLPDVPTVPYAPPGTVRDNNRSIPGPVFNIEGHGFIACLDPNLDIWKPT